MEVCGDLCEIGSSDAALGAEQFIYPVDTSWYVPLAMTLATGSAAYMPVT